MRASAVPAYDPATELLRLIYESDGLVRPDGEDPGAVSGLSSALERDLVRDQSSGWSVAHHYVLTKKGREHLGLPVKPSVLTMMWSMLMGVRQRPT